MKRILYIEYLRFFSVLAVISIHVSAMLVLSYEKYGFTYWWFGNIIDGASRWCVPIFVMISGALLLHPKKEESISTFFKKRASRIIIPFVFFIIFYFFWGHRNNLEDYSLIRILKELTKGPVYYHLWYVYMIIGLLLITPILRVFIKHCERKHLELFIGIWFVSQLASLLRLLFGLELGISFRVATDFVGYFILGYYLHTFDLPKRFRMVLHSFGLISVLAIWFGTYILMLKNNFKHNGFFYNYNSITVVLVSASIFVLFKNMKIRESTGFHQTFVLKVSALSYGIYLIHAFVKDFIEIYFDVNVLFIHPIAGYLVSLVLILLISLSLTWLANFCISLLQPATSLSRKRIES